MWLAANVFHKPVAWCLENIDSAEFTDWMAYRDIVTGKVKAAPAQRQSPQHQEMILRTFFNAQRHKSVIRRNGER